MSATASIYEQKIHTYSTLPADAGEISAEDLSQRVIILTRFRELLKAQRDRFQDYLLVLDKQADAIVQGTVEELSAHVALEEQIVTDIRAIQKVIDPLEALYRTVKGEEDLELTGLKNALTQLGKDAVTRTNQNKELLSNRMDSLRMEIKNMRINPFSTPISIYGRNEEPSLIDIRG